MKRLALVVLACHFRLLATEPCNSTETVQECNARLLAEGTATAQKAATTNASTDQTATANTGATTARPFSSATTTFARILGATLDTVTISEAKEGLSAEAAFPVRGTALAVRLQGTLRRPKLSDQTLQAIKGSPEGTSDLLEKQLQDFDDSSILVAGRVLWSGARHQLGAAHLWNGATMTLDPVFTSIGERDFIIEEVPSCAGSTFGTLDDKACPRVRSALSSLANDLDALRKGRLALREDPIGSAFHQLIANEAQGFLSIQHDERDPLVGQSVTNVNATYEWAPLNLGTFLKQDDACRNASDNAAECWKRFATWIQSPGRQSLAKAGLRFSATFTAQWGRGFAVMRGDPGILLSRPSTRSIIGTLKAAGVLVGALDKPGSLRLDMTGSYEDVTGDPMRQDRVIASGTLTYRVSADLQVPVGLIYSSKPEYLADPAHKPDKTLSAHLGLTLKLPM